MSEREDAEWAARQICIVCADLIGTHLNGRFGVVVMVQGNGHECAGLAHEDCLRGLQAVEAEQ